MESTTSTSPGDGSVARSSAVVLDDLRRNREAEARLQAERYALIDELRHLNGDDAHVITRPTAVSASTEELVQRVTAAEVGLTLLVHERTAATMIREAEQLADAFPATFAALRSGELTPSRTRAMLSAAIELPDDVLGDFETYVLDGRLDVSSSSWKRRCARAAEKARPTTLDERHANALGRRRVALSDAGDGLTWLSALLPTHEAHLIHTALSGTAQHARDAGDPRTLDQLRADALRDAALGIHDDIPTSSDEPENALRTVRATVIVTVPALSLLERGADISTLEGLGPIPADVAKALAGGDERWLRVLTDPWSGEHLAMGRKTYRVPTSLKRWVRFRGSTCSFPGCTRPAEACEMEHVIPWGEGGETNADNLCPECAGHHRLRHHSGFEIMIEHDTGDVIWTDPTGLPHHSPPFDGIVPDPPDLSGIGDVFTLGE